MLLQFLALKKSIFSRKMEAFFISSIQKASRSRFVAFLHSLPSCLLLVLFYSPVQAAISANTYVISGEGENKSEHSFVLFLVSLSFPFFFICLLLLLLTQSSKIFFLEFCLNWEVMEWRVCGAWHPLSVLNSLLPLELVFQVLLPRLLMRTKTFQPWSKTLSKLLREMQICPLLLFPLNRLLLHLLLLRQSLPVTSLIRKRMILRLLSLLSSVILWIPLLCFWLMRVFFLFCPNDWREAGQEED